MKKRNTNFLKSKKGFSLLEVLIAVAILAVIVVPLAMNMISSSRLNTKSKETGIAADLNTSIIDTVQQIPLSSVMTEVNGYKRNSKGNPLKYSLVEDTLKDFDVKIDAMREVAFEPLGTGAYKYTPLSGITGDPNTSSSIYAQKDNGTIVDRTFFVGRPDDKYGFIITGIKDKNKELNLDVVARIEADDKELEGEDMLANITSMNRSDVFTAIQEKKNSYIAGKLGTSENNISNEITITIQRDPSSLHTECTAVAKYTGNGHSVEEKLGVYNNDNSGELLKAIYVFYEPMKSRKETFIINNPNSVPVPVYLVPMLSDAEKDKYLDDANIKYHVTEGGTSLDESKIVICTPVHDRDMHVKPNAGSKTVEVKNLGNETKEATLYHITVEVFQHRKDSFASDGTYVPRLKERISSTEATFIDTSEKYDLDPDLGGGGYSDGSTASVITYDYNYDGEEKTGVTLNHAVLVEGRTSITKATNVGSYGVWAKPEKGSKWFDGGTEERYFEWHIKAESITDEIPQNLSYEYTGKEIECFPFDANKFEASGTLKAINAGVYTVKLTPKDTFAWSDNTIKPKNFIWSITPRVVHATWSTTDRWPYDKKSHSIDCWVDTEGERSVLPGDKCDILFTNNSIQNVGKKKVDIVGLSNNNYVLSADTPKSHVIEVFAAEQSYVILNEDSSVYCGKKIEFISEMKDVNITGMTYGVDAGKYIFKATPTPGSTWEDGSDVTRTFTYIIKKKPVTVEWLEDPKDTEKDPDIYTWVYDGKPHGAQCKIAPYLDNGGVVSGDQVAVVIPNNEIEDVGEKGISISGLTNKNYEVVYKDQGNNIVTDRTKTLKIVHNRGAYIIQDNFVYDGTQRILESQFIDVIKGTLSEKDCNINNNKTAYIPYTVTVKPSANYTWKDLGNNEDPQAERTVKWWIYPKDISNIQFEKVIEIDKTITQYWAKGIHAHCIKSNYNQFEGLHDLEVTEGPGTYEATFIPDMNYNWTDIDSTIQQTDIPIEARDITVKVIKLIKCSKPYMSSDFKGFIYNGTVQGPEIEKEIINPNDSVYFDLVAREVEGNDVIPALKATNAHKYVIQAVPKEDYKWDDWTIDPKEPVNLYWEIKPRPVTLSYAPSKYNAKVQTLEPNQNVGDVVESDRSTFALGYNPKDLSERQKLYGGLSANKINVTTIYKAEEDANNIGEMLYTVDTNYYIKNDPFSYTPEITPVNVKVGLKGYKENIITVDQERGDLFNSINDWFQKNLVVDGILTEDLNNYKVVLERQTIINTGKYVLKMHIEGLKNGTVEGIKASYYTNATLTVNVEEAGIPVPDGWVYYVGVPTTQTEIKPDYTEMAQEVIYSPHKMPEKSKVGDILVSANKEYEYRYSQKYDPFNTFEWKVESFDGWGVKYIAQHNAATQPGVIVSNINNKPVLNASGVYHMTTFTTLPNNLPETLTVLDGAFSNASVTKINNIPSKTVSMINIFENSGLQKADNLVIPESVQSMQGAFKNAIDLGTAPKMDKAINARDLRDVFADCHNLRTPPILSAYVTSMERTFTNTSSMNECPGLSHLTNLKTLSQTFEGSAIQTVKPLPNTLEDMNGAFKNCRSLQQMPIIEHCTRLKTLNNTFSGATSLTLPSSGATIPASVKEMENTFNGCSSLRGMIVFDGTLTRYNGCFAGSAQSEGNKIYLSGKNVETLRNMKYSETRLNGKYIIIREIIPKGAVYYVNLVSDKEPYNQYTAKYVGGELFPEETYDGDAFVYGDYEYRYNRIPEPTKSPIWRSPKYADTKNGWSVIVKEGSKYKASFQPVMEYINNKPLKAMRNTYNGTNITSPAKIPSTVKDIGSIYWRCYNLMSFPEVPNTITHMECAFWSCISIDGPVNIPEGITNLDAIFSYCYNLKITPTLPSTAQNLQNTFNACSRLTQIPVIPSSVTEMYGTFNGCSSIKGTMIINSSQVNDTRNCMHGTAQDSNHKIYLQGTGSLSAKSKIRSSETTLKGKYIYINGSIPYGYKYYPDVKSTELGVYLDASGNQVEPLVAGDAMPYDINHGDVIVYNGYEYRWEMYYNMMSSNAYWSGSDYGWGVRVLDPNQTSYSDIPDTIGGKEVTHLISTFEKCPNIIVSPQVSQNATSMRRMFEQCRQLQIAPNIPDGCIDIQSLFGFCSQLRTHHGSTDNSAFTDWKIPSTVTNMNYAFWYCSNLNGSMTILTNNDVTWHQTFQTCAKYKRLILKGEPYNEALRRNICPSNIHKHIDWE